LDKKLILDAKKIVISKQSNVEHSFDDIKKDINKLPIYLKFFQQVHIENLQISGNSFVIEINDKILFIDNKFINISAKPKFGINDVSMELYSLYLKDTDTLLNGDIYVDLLNDTTKFTGTYSRNGVNGKLNITGNEKFLDFSLDSNNQENIHFVKDFVRLAPGIEVWMYDNVLGTYKLNKFEGRISTVDFQPIIKSFKGSATVSDARIRFHKDVDYVNSKKVTVTFNNDNLSFDLEKPTYKDIDINGSNVVIYNISGANSNIDVNLETQNRFSQDIIDIIAAYGAHVPIIQLDGTTNSKLTINVNFKTLNVTTKGEFSSKKANFKIKDLTFLATDAKVKLNNNNIYITDANVTYNDNLNAMLDLKIDTAVSTATGLTKINFFNIKTDNNDIISIKDEISNFDVDFNENVQLDFRELLTSVNINEESIDVRIKKLETIYEKSKLLQSLKAKHGTLFLSIYTLENIGIKADVYNLDLPIKRDNEYISSLEIQGTIKDDIVEANTTDNRLSLYMNDDVINLSLNNTDIVFDTNSTGLDTIKRDINLKFNKSNIDLKDIYTFDVDSFNILKNKSGLTFYGDILNPNIPVLEEGKPLEKLKISGSYINEKLNVKSANDKINLEVNEKGDTVANITGYDISYDTNSSNSFTNKKILLNGHDSSIVINNKYKLLSNKYNFILDGNEVVFDSFYNQSTINLKQDPDGYKTVNGNNLDGELISSFLDKKLISGGKVNFVSSGFDDNIKGKVFLENNKIENLAFVNNLILFLNTSPALVNPFFIIPAVINIAQNKGVSVDGYYVKKGNIEFDYDLSKNIFNAEKIVTEGSVVDFNGYAKLDFENSEINSTMNVAFLKVYSNIVKEIPILNYIFLGEDNKVTTKVDISGDLNDPKYTTNLVEDGAKIPIDVVKRIFNLPKKAIDSLSK